MWSPLACSRTRRRGLAHTFRPLCGSAYSSVNTDCRALVLKSIEVTPESLPCKTSSACVSPALVLFATAAVSAALECGTGYGTAWSRSGVLWTTGPFSRTACDGRACRPALASALAASRMCFSFMASSCWAMAALCCRAELWACHVCRSLCSRCCFSAALATIWAWFSRSYSATSAFTAVVSGSVHNLYTVSFNVSAGVGVIARSMPGSAADHFQQRAATYSNFPHAPSSHRMLLWCQNVMQSCCICREGAPREKERVCVNARWEQTRCLPLLPSPPTTTRHHIHARNSGSNLLFSIKFAVFYCFMAELCLREDHFAHYAGRSIGESKEDIDTSVTAAGEGKIGVHGKAMKQRHTHGQ